MGLLFFDGCDLYSNGADITEAGYSHTSCGVMTGRFTSAGVFRGALSPNTVAAHVERASLPTVGTTFLLQFAFALAGTWADGDLVSLHSDSNDVFTVRLLSTGALRFLDSNGATIATTAAGLIIEERWAYLEIKLTNIGTSGTAYVRLNGRDVVLNAGGVDLQEGGATAFVNRFRFHGFNTGQNLRVDDIIAMDGTGSSHNDLLGDCAVTPLLPNATVWNAVWLSFPDSSPNDHQAVDDAVPGDHDGDSTYVAAVNGLLEMSVADLPSEIQQVHAVNVATAARHTVASGSLITGIKDPVADEEITEAFDLTGSYTTKRMAAAASPTGAPWTPALVNQCEVTLLHNGESG